MMKKALGLFLILLCTNAFPNDELIPSNNSNSSGHNPYKLVLFFSNQCPHCVRFAPVIKYLQDGEDWEVEAISLNEGTLPEFPNAIFATQNMIDNVYHGNPVVYPALFIANKTTKNIYPVVYGEMEPQELQERIVLILDKIKAYERGLLR